MGKLIDAIQRNNLQAVVALLEGEYRNSRILSVKLHNNRRFIN